MASAVLDMSVSLDGFIAGPCESWDDDPLCDGGGYVHGRCRARRRDFPATLWGHQAGAGTFEPAAAAAAAATSLEVVQVLEGEHGMTYPRYHVRRGA